MQTMRDLLTHGAAAFGLSDFVVVDCRYDYEHAGGRLPGGYWLRVEGSKQSIGLLLTPLHHAYLGWNVWRRQPCLHVPGPPDKSRLVSPLPSCCGPSHLPACLHQVVSISRPSTAGAVHLTTPEELTEFLASPRPCPDYWQNTAIIFHCEFSTERGPRAAKYVRNKVSRPGSRAHMLKADGAGLQGDRAMVGCRLPGWPRRCCVCREQQSVRKAQGVSQHVTGDAPGLSGWSAQDCSLCNLYPRTSTCPMTRCCTNLGFLPPCFPLPPCRTARHTCTTTLSSPTRTYLFCRCAAQRCCAVGLSLGLNEWHVPVHALAATSHATATTANCLIKKVLHSPCATAASASHVALLQGGYKAFWKSFSELCDGGYTPMDHPDFGQQLKVGEQAQIYYVRNQVWELEYKRVQGLQGRMPCVQPSESRAVCIMRAASSLPLTPLHTTYPPPAFPPLCCRRATTL